MLEKAENSKRTHKMKNLLLSVFALFAISNFSNSQSCTPQGNQTSYGTSNVWRAYVYDGTSFNTYKGYVTEGSAGSPNFDESFGGSNTTFNTNGCSTTTETFSVRFRLTKSFTNGTTYTFTVGGDDGYRLSLDGGTTWVINQWNDQSYTTTTYTTSSLSGSKNMVLEYYENSGENRISFSVVNPGTENTNTYGTNNIWRAYVYDDINFSTYAGMINEGTSTSPSFTENFGGGNTTFTTTGLSVQTETFSVRLRLTKSFAAGSYTFFVGGDDGYRFSLDGGNTWIINKWVDQGYGITNVTKTLTAGSYNMVIEYYENSGENMLSFSYQAGNTLAIKLMDFSGKEENNSAKLNWNISTSSDPDYFEIERSADGNNFAKINKVNGNNGINNGNAINFNFTDTNPFAGKSIYRLKMVDMSGAVTYSNAVVVTTNSVRSNQVKIFPTVISNNAVSINSNATLNNAIVYLTDATGRPLANQKFGKITAGQTISFPVAAAHNMRGVYFISITDNNTTVTTQKVMIQ